MDTVAVPRRRALKTSERLARDIARSIVDGKLEEGSRLPHESDMLEQLGVGRATLREALRLLEVWGLVTIRTGPGGGPTVRRPKPAEFGEHLGLMLQFQQFTLADVTDARMALEPMVARLAADRITTQRIAELRETITLMRENIGDQTVFWHENDKFHSLVAESAESIVLLMFDEALKTIGDGSLAGVLYSKKQLELVISAHERIVDALEAHDPDAAATEMHRHLYEGRKYGERRYPGALRSLVRLPD